MKKAGLKVIKKFAASLPKTIEEYNEIAQMRGAEFIKKGILRVNGEDIDPDLLYTSRTTKVRELNHFRRLKRLFAAGDKNAGDTYSQWLIAHNKRVAEKYPKLFKKFDKLEHEHSAV